MTPHLHAMSMDGWQDSWTLSRVKDRLVLGFNVYLNYHLKSKVQTLHSVNRSYIYGFINFSLNDWTHDAKMLFDFSTRVWGCKGAVQIWSEEHFLEQRGPLLHWGFIFPPLEMNRRNKVVTQPKNNEVHCLWNVLGLQLQTRFLCSSMFSSCVFYIDTIICNVYICKLEFWNLLNFNYMLILNKGLSESKYFTVWEDMQGDFLVLLVLFIYI